MLGWLVFMSWVVGIVTATLAILSFDIESVLPREWRKGNPRKLRFPAE